MTTRVGSATGTNTATMPAHQVGDLIVAFGLRDGSTTGPSIPPEGWTPLAASNSSVAAVGTSCSAVMVAKIADSTSEAVGTFTNATFVGVVVYRAGSGKKLGIGTWAHQVGTASSVTYPATTLIGASSTSWAGAFAGHRSTNTSLQTAPTNMANVATFVDATNEGAIHDTNGPVASWPSTAVAVGGTASGWITASFEIREYTTALARYEAARDHPTDNALVIGIGHSHMAAAGAVTNNSLNGDAIKFGYLQQVADAFTACVARSSDASFMGDQNVTANGFSPANYNQNLTLSTWAAYAPVSTLGAKAFTPGSAGTLTWEPDVAFDRLQVFYPRVNGVPEYTVNVDGGSSLGTLNMNDTTQVFASETFSVSDTTHDVRIVAGSTGGLIAGALVWRSTVKQLTFLNCSWAGALVTDYLDASTVWSPYNAIQTFGNVAATIIHLDKNEELTGVALEAFRYNLASLVLARLLFGDVILISSVLTNPTTYSEATQTTYHDAVAAWATLMGCGYVSGSAQPGFSTYASANGLGYFNTDGIHIFAAGGQIAYADPLLALLDVAAVSAEILPPAASLAIAGAAPSVATGASVAPPAAAISIAAVAPAVSAASNVEILAPAASIAIAGQAPAISTGAAIAPPAAGIGVAGFAPGVQTGAAVEAPVAAVSIAGQAPTLATGAAVAVPAAAIGISGAAPGLSTGVAIAAPAAGLTVSGLAPGIATGAVVAAPSASVAIEGSAPAVATGAAIEPPAGVIAIAGAAPSLANGASILAPAAAITVAGFAPSLSSGAIIAAPAAAIGVTGHVPAVSTGAAIAAPVAVLSVVVYPPGVSTGAAIHPPAANENVAGLAPSVETGAAIAPPTAQVSIGGVAPTIITGAAVQPPVVVIQIGALAPAISTGAGAEISPPAASITITALAPFRVGFVGTGDLRRVHITGVVNDHVQLGGVIESRVSITSTLTRRG